MLLVKIDTRHHKVIKYCEPREHVGTCSLVFSRFALFALAPRAVALSAHVRRRRCRRCRSARLRVLPPSAVTACRLRGGHDCCVSASLSVSTALSLVGQSLGQSLRLKSNSARRFCPAACAGRALVFRQPHPIFKFVRLLRLGRAAPAM